MHACQEKAIEMNKRKYEISISFGHIERSRMQKANPQNVARNTNCIVGKEKKGFNFSFLQDN